MALRSMERNRYPVERCAEETPGSWMVYRPGAHSREYEVFVEWREGKPVIGHDGGMIFTYEGMARHVAQKLGEGWTVIDVSQKAIEETEKLLAAIFGERKSVGKK